MRCSLNSDSQLSNEIQILFFARPKDIQLSNPNLRIVSIQQKSSMEIVFTIHADKPALFVWIDIPNGFHMFEQEITVTFTSQTFLSNFHSYYVDLRLTSLYDVTQP